MIRKMITAIRQVLTRTPSDALSDTKQLDALRKQVEGLKGLASKAQRWAEEAESEIDEAVYADEQWSEAVQEMLNALSVRLGDLEGAIGEISIAKEVVAFVRSSDGKESLQGLRQEIDCLKESITKDRDERQQIATHARQWVAMAEEIETKIVAINEIVIGLAEVAVSDYYEGARKRISTRYRNLWIGFWVLTFVVFIITLIPEARTLIRSESIPFDRGATDALINFLSTRAGTLTILGAALFTIRTSLRRTEKTEKEYETKALRLKTTIAAKDSGLSDSLLNGIAVAIKPDPDDEE